MGKVSNIIMMLRENTAYDIIGAPEPLTWRMHVAMPRALKRSSTGMAGCWHRCFQSSADSDEPNDGPDFDLLRLSCSSSSSSESEKVWVLVLCWRGRG